MNPLTSLCTCFAVLPGLHLWRCQLQAQHSSLYTCCSSAQFCLCNQSKAEDSLPWGEQRLPGLSAAQGLPQLPQRAMKRFCWTPGSREPDRQVAGQPDAESSLAQSPLSDLAPATFFPVAKESGCCPALETSPYPCSSSSS